MFKVGDKIQIKKWDDIDIELYSNGEDSTDAEYYLKDNFKLNTPYKIISVETDQIDVEVEKYLGDESPSIETLFNFEVELYNCVNLPDELFTM